MLGIKHRLPFNIFITFEKINPIIYTSEILTSNHYIVLINSNWYYSINFFLKKDLLTSFNYLSESTCIDTLGYSNLFEKNEICVKNTRFIFQNTFYLYSSKTRITFFTPYNLKKKLDSLDNIYKNSNWLEREVSEMFSIIFKNKLDSRSLLLDYSKNEHPMLKDFPTEGLYELYYDFFDSHLHYVNSEHIEL